MTRFVFYVIQATHRVYYVPVIWLSGMFAILLVHVNKQITIDCVKVLPPTRPTFWRRYSQPISWLSIVKLNQTQQKQTCILKNILEHKINTQKTKARYCRFLRPPAWKRKEPIILEGTDNKPQWGTYADGVQRDRFATGGKWGANGRLGTLAEIFSQLDDGSARFTNVHGFLLDPNVRQESWSLFPLSFTVCCLSTPF